MEILSKFWVKIGCNIVYMSLKEHDHIFSITSHIPHLVAYNMVKTAMNFEKKKKSNIVKFSAGGLRDFTRTAASNEVMWKDIFLNNINNFCQYLGRSYPRGNFLNPERLIFRCKIIFKL